MLTTDLFHAGLTVHGVINGSMIQQGVASSKISNVSSGPLSQIQMSLLQSPALPYVIKYCMDNNHEDATITCI